MRVALFSLTIVAGVVGSVLGAVIQDERVTNGTVSPQGQAPYFAQLLVNQGGENYSRCGATIIDETTVITAAHCIYSTASGSAYPAEKVYVIYGSVKSLDGTYVRATKVSAHPQYTGGGALHNDIAIVQVPKMELKPGFAEKITVFNGDIKPKQEMQIFGWGKTRTGGSSSDSPQSLLTQKVYVGEPKDCKDIDSTYEDANGSLICANNNYNVGVDVCQGDSGTGTTVISGGKAYFAGLVSYGRDKYYNPTCGEAGSFGMYTRVSYFAKWIESVTGKAVAVGPLATATTPTQTPVPTPKPTSSFCFFFICF
ncbi:hypothetical protein H4S06_000199 [Coemansia sp. BCRC 34490]|nr:hypothetical protein H4S06_000199 [Coemansia sp. BCRC 34490]